ncbi:MAG: SDR family NAD(P)-dependent oxidoreductase [Patescibacteria group bacterium]|nr:SDR family NAD(P)-dependent oxidoreductase [Patescibacteria group bacterium]
MKPIILITGVSSGIGEALCLSLRDIYTIIGISRKKPQDTDNYTWLQVDVTDMDEHAELYQYLQDNNIQLDGVIHNAGIGYFGELSSIDWMKRHAMLETNLIAPLEITQDLLDQKLLQEKAKIIFIGSHAAKKSLKHGAVYQATKFAIRGYAMGLKNELTQKVHIINPSIVDTNFHNESDIDMSVHKQTKMEDIVFSAGNILLGEDQRFEIDL